MLGTVNRLIPHVRILQIDRNLDRARLTASIRHLRNDVRQQRRNVACLAWAFRGGDDASQHRHLLVGLVYVAETAAVESGFGLTGDHQYAARRVRGFVQPRHGVRGTRAGARDHHTDFAGGSRIAVRRVCAGLLVAHIDQLREAEPVDGVEDRHVVDADDRERMTNTERFQRARDEIGPGAAHAAAFSDDRSMR